MLGRFELVFVDAPGGKSERLERTLDALAPGGTLLLEDVTPQRCRLRHRHRLHPRPARPDRQRRPCGWLRQPRPSGHHPPAPPSRRRRARHRRAAPRGRHRPLCRRDRPSRRSRPAGRDPGARRRLLPRPATPRRRPQGQLTPSAGTAAGRTARIAQARATVRPCGPERRGVGRTAKVDVRLVGGKRSADEPLSLATEEPPGSCHEGAARRADASGGRSGRPIVVRRRAATSADGQVGICQELSCWTVVLGYVRWAFCVECPTRCATVGHGSARQAVRVFPARSSQGDRRSGRSNRHLVQRVDRRNGLPPAAAGSGTARRGRVGSRARASV